jgi:hypothetical protein
MSRLSRLRLPRVQMRSSLQVRGLWLRRLRLLSVVGLRLQMLD